MSDVICVTNRHLCEGKDFLTHLKAIAQAKPKAILLREKDLSAESYRALAEQVLAICQQQEIPCILHYFADVAQSLKTKGFHGSMTVLRSMSDAQRHAFESLGASCHSIEDAIEAQALGCTYLVAGHIFETDCKKGLPGRGLDFLSAVCQQVRIPVYAIGGISPENYPAVKSAGAAGVCIMSGLMQCENTTAYMKRFKEVESCP